MKAIKIDKTGGVLIDTLQGFNVWMDVYEESGELIADWNKYIFRLDNQDDLDIRKFQENIDNYDEASSIAISYYRQHK